ncbi:MAG: hypothetical protein Q8T09_05060 [Candidatus Melainabacteria bacterium]|nr:hypothetical protein [Candidatus Melainabacteria bacterium]
MASLEPNSESSTVSPGAKNTGPVVEHVFRRRIFKHLLRYFYLFMLIGLSVSMPMSMLERAQLHHHIDLASELFLLLFIVGINALILPSAFFEVNGIIVKADGLKIETMLFPVSVPFDQIVSLTVPNYLVWAVLRTKRGFYLINRRDIANLDELVGLLAPKLPSGVL